MLKYCFIILSLVFTLTETKAKPEKSLSDDDAVIGIVNKYGKTHTIKQLNDMPFGVIADAVRKQLEKHVGDTTDVTYNKYFALLEEVSNEIMPSDN